MVYADSEPTVITDMNTTTPAITPRLVKVSFLVITRQLLYAMFFSDSTPVATTDMNTTTATTPTLVTSKCLETTIT